MQGIRKTDEEKRKDVLLLFSGGRDSFLSACKLIESNYQVHMLSFINGHMSGDDCLADMAARIVNIYGADRVDYLGKMSVTADLFQLLHEFLYLNVSQLCLEYPDLRSAQMPCLACHTAMIVRAIAYCKLNNIHYISGGERRSQGMIVELPDMIERYKDMGKHNGVELILPVYDLEDDWDRKLQLAGRGFIPKTMEMQCWLGCPLEKSLSVNEVASLIAYYDKVMQPIIQDKIDALVSRGSGLEPINGEAFI